MSKKTLWMVFALILVAVPGLADGPLAAEITASEEEIRTPKSDLSTAEEPAEEEVPIDLQAIFGGTVFDDDQKVQAGTCVPCIISYCSAPGWRCVIDKCLPKRQCCTYTCHADLSCTTSSCPANVCFCASEF